MPESEEKAVLLLQQYAEDLGHDMLTDIDDLESLVDSLKLLAGESIHSKPNPFKRIGKAPKVDQWVTFDEITELGAKCKKWGWILQERVMYYSLIRGGSVIMKIQGLRPTRGGGYSFRLMIPRMHSYPDLELFLEQNDLEEFKDREWVVGSGLCEIGKEILGRYFYFEDLHIILEKLTERIANDKATKKLAGLQLNQVSGSGDESSEDQ